MKYVPRIYFIYTVNNGNRLALKTGGKCLFKNPATRFTLTIFVLSLYSVNPHISIYDTHTNTRQYSGFLGWTRVFSVGLGFSRLDSGVFAYVRRQVNDIRYLTPSSCCDVTPATSSSTSTCRARCSWSSRGSASGSTGKQQPTGSLSVSRHIVQLFLFYYCHHHQ